MKVDKNPPQPDKVVVMWQKSQVTKFRLKAQQASIDLKSWLQGLKLEGRCEAVLFSNMW